MAFDSEGTRTIMEGESCMTDFGSFRIRDLGWLDPSKSFSWRMTKCVLSNKMFTVILLYCPSSR